MLSNEDIDSLVFDVEALNLNLLVANPLLQRGWELAIGQVISLLKSKKDNSLCPKCSGSGRDARQEILSGQIVYCPVCDGTGKKMKEEECAICHGKGSTTDHHDPCSECGGSGYYGMKGN